MTITKQLATVIIYRHAISDKVFAKEVYSFLNKTSGTWLDFRLMLDDLTDEKLICLLEMI